MPAVYVTASMVMFMVTEVIRAVALRDTPIAQIVWLRYGWHLLLMLVVFGMPTRLSFLRTDRMGVHLVRSLMMLVMPLAYVVAARTVNGAAIFGIFAVSPLIVLAFGRLAGERLPRLAVPVALVGWLGALLLYRTAVATPGWGIAAAGAMAVSYSAYIALTRVLDRTEPLLTNLFYSATGVFVVLTAAAPLFWRRMGAREIAAGCALAVSGWIVLWLLEMGLRRTTASRAAVFLLVQPLVDGLLRIADQGRSINLRLTAGTAVVGLMVLVAFIWIAPEPGPAVGAGRPAEQTT